MNPRPKRFPQQPNESIPSRRLSVGDPLLLPPPRRSPPPQQEMDWIEEDDYEDHGDEDDGFPVLIEPDPPPSSRAYENSSFPSAPAPLPPDLSDAVLDAVDWISPPLLDYRGFSGKRVLLAVGGGVLVFAGVEDSRAVDQSHYEHLFSLDSLCRLWRSPSRRCSLVLRVRV